MAITFYQSGTEDRLRTILQPKQSGNKNASFTNTTKAVTVVVVSIHDYVEEIYYNDLVKIFPIISKCHK